MGTRVIVIFDVDKEPRDFDQLRPGEGFLDRVEMGVKLGVGDALGEKRPVRIVRSIVTGGPEKVVLVNPEVPGYHLALT